MSLKLNSSGGGSVTLQEPVTASNLTLTLPAATGTAVLETATQTLTNKTLGSGLVMGASAITAGTAVASTSGTSIDFTGIPSWVKRITVMFSGVSTSGISSYQVQLGAGSVTTSGYVSSCMAGQTGVAVTSITSGHALLTSVLSNMLINGFAVFTAISGNVWIGVSAVTTTGTNGYGNGTSTVTLSGTLDRLRITTVNGTDTFDAGTINILYE